jgi:hypothetical protein
VAEVVELSFYKHEEFTSIPTTAKKSFKKNSRKRAMNSNEGKFIEFYCTVIISQ